MFKRLIIAIFTIFILFSRNVFAAVWYVDSVSDVDLGMCLPGEMVDDNNCTLRDAISQAVNPGDEIKFLGMDPEKFTDNNPIVLTSLLEIAQDNIVVGRSFGPTDSTNVVIDGQGLGNVGLFVSGSNVDIENLTLVGFNRALVVDSTSNGSNARNMNIGAKLDGLTVPTYRNSNGLSVRGTNFTLSDSNVKFGTGNGIEVEDTVTDFTIGGSNIINNDGHGVKYVGTGTASFNAGDGGFVEGIMISRSFLTGSQTVIQGNGVDGVSFSTGTINNSTFKITGSIIGNTGVGNAGYGINIGSSGSGNTVQIGTDGDLSNDSIEGNSIQYNANGIFIGGSVENLRIAGNTIQNNSNAGITVSSTSLTGVTIGGDIDDERNNIGSSATGIEILDAGVTSATIMIQGNYIGFLSDGVTSAALTGVAVSVADGVAIDISNNVIGNVGDTAVSITGGIYFSFYNNKIGTDTSGIVPAGVTNYGLYINAPQLSRAVIGGANAGNIFAATSVSDDGSGAGLYIVGLAFVNAPVTIQGNYFGIGSDGITTLGLGNASYGAKLSIGDIKFGGDNSFGEDGTGDLDEGNVVSNNTADGCIYVPQGSSVNFLTINGNIFGLKKGPVSGIYDTAAGNGDEVTDACLDLRGENINSLIIGQGAGVESSTNTSRRNIISGNAGIGINLYDLAASAIATIHNNYIGTDYLGATSVGNGGTGIYVNDAGSGFGGLNIGGMSGSEGNLISGNGSTLATDAGIDIGGSDNPFFVNIYDNYIGTNAAGDAALANAGGGILVRNSAAIVNIGDGIASTGNLISGNTGSGVKVSAGNVKIQGNTIGMNAAGTDAVANGSGIYIADILNYGGVLISGGSVTVGTEYDNDSSKRNYISGNAGFGIGITGASAAIIAGNYIGLNVVGTGVVPNSDGSDTLSAINGAGIAIYDTTGNTVDRTVIGTSSEDADDITNRRNYISGNSGAGIAILHGTGDGQDWSGGYIKNNYIGVDTSGDISSGFKNTDYAIIADSASSATIIGLSIGGTPGGNTLNNTDHVAVRINDLTLSNAATMVTDNTYTDAEAATYRFWENYVDGDPLYACNDTIDNDTDGAIDYPDDPGCTSAIDNDETDPLYACNDTIDNDTDGAIDDDDPGCTSAIDNDETDPVVIDEEPAPQTGGGGGTVAISSLTTTPVTTVVKPEVVVPVVVRPIVVEPVVVKVPTTEDIRKQQVALQKAVSPIVDAITLKPISVDTVKQVISQQNAERALAESQPVAVKSVEAQVVEKVINKILVESDKQLTRSEKVEVNKAIETKVNESLSNVFSDAVSAGKPIVAHVGGGRTINISNPDNVKVLSTFALSSAEKMDVESQANKARAEGKQVLIVDERSDLANDSVSDVLKLTLDIPIFNADKVDDDGVKVSDELWIGLDAKKADGLPEKPIVSVGRVGTFDPKGADVVKSDKDVFVRVGGQPGDNVEVVAVESDNLVAQIVLGNGIIDEGGKLEISTNDSKLVPGLEYIILANGKNGLGKGDRVIIVDNPESITLVDNAGSVSGITPSLTPTDKAGQVMGITTSLNLGDKAMPAGGIIPSLKTIKSVYNSFNKALSNLFASVLSINKQVENLKVAEVVPVATLVSESFSGDAEPGSVIVVTWKSVILSSVVVADASQGKFKVEVPSDLPKGDHEVMVFAYNPSKKSVSTLSTLKFKK